MKYWIEANRRSIIIFLVSLVSGLLAFTVLVLATWHQGLNPISLTGDARGYIALAQNLIDHQVFSFSTHPPYAPESFRAPGYSFFLAILYGLTGNWLTVLFLQVMIVSIAPVLLYLLFKPYHERAAFWGSLIFAVEPVHLFLSASLLSDALYVCLFLLSLVLLEQGARLKRRNYFIFSGLVLGTSILVRPIAIFLPALYAGYLLLSGRFSKQSIVGAMMLSVACFIVIFPWMLRNHANFGSWNISSVGSANLMIYNAPAFLQYSPNARGQEVLRQFQLEQDALPRSDALSLARGGVFTSTFFDVIREHEISYGFFHVIKTIPFFVTDGLRDTVRLFNVDIGVMPNISTALLHGDIETIFRYLRTGDLAITLLILGSSFWIIVTLLFGYTVVDALRSRSYKLAFLLVVPVFYFAILTGPVSNARYRLPVEGLLIVAAISAVLRKHRHVLE